MKTSEFVVDWIDDHLIRLELLQKVTTGFGFLFNECLEVEDHWLELLEEINVILIAFRFFEYKENER